ncbi:hypothetical protein [Streptomyces sp. NPDC056165]|uniref:hypothetical protein n=1 Tax=Streptomyces sp. NPDC056165 TaxID=3345733 RepID=UPI0035D6AA70
MTLYIGGGVVAIIHSLRGRSRQVWQRHRAATVTTAAGVVAVASTTVALLMPSSSTATPTTPSGPDGAPPAVSPEAAPVSGTPPSKDDALSVYDTTAEEPLNEDDLESPASPSQASDFPPADPASTTEPATEDDAGTTPAATPDTTPRAPADPPPAVPPAVVAPPVSTSAPAPQPPDPSAEKNDQDNGKKGICVEVPRLLDLCLLGGK